jgi:hypothetical protein
VPHTIQSREPQDRERQTPNKIQPASAFDQISPFAGCADESTKKVKQKYRSNRHIDDVDEVFDILINREKRYQQIDDRQKRQSQDEYLIIGSDGFLLAACCHGISFLIDQ